MQENDFDIDAVDHSPIVEKNEAVFLYKGSADTVYLTGEYNRWALEDRFRRFPNGNPIWFIKKTFPRNARFEYKFVVDGKWIKDPLNAMPSDLSDNSNLVMPEYHSRYDAIISHSSPRGALVENLRLRSRYLGRDMKYHIYLPPGYKPGNGHILYALDGSDYLHFAKINLVLDYLIDSKEIPSLIAVLADPGDRDMEYTIYGPTLKYLSDELMPAIESEYLDLKAASAGTGPDRSVIGVSWGGLTAIYLAVSKPYAFNRVLSQSGSFWPKNWLLTRIVKESGAPAKRFCLQTGTIQDTEEVNDAMVTLLNAKGHRVDYMKYAESHSWCNWRGHLDEGLKALFL